MYIILEKHDIDVIISLLNQLSGYRHSTCHI